MEIDIRKSIKDNFEDQNIDEIKKAIYEREEITLPGLGVFFEILWNNSNDTIKDYILQTLSKVLN